jgi:hypothetical protein
LRTGRFELDIGQPISPAPLGFFNGVSCKRPSACIAVGYYLNTSGVQVPLAESFDGTSWTLRTAATPTGATGTHLNAVDCTGLTLCVAVGFFNPAPPATGSEPFGGKFDHGNAMAPFRF